MPSASQTDPNLIHAERLLTYYGYSIMLVLGNIGNYFNIILFSRKKLLKTSCNNYFLAASFTNLIALNVSIISTIYMESHPEHISVLFCKIEVYIMTITLQMSRFFVLAASFDRFALSSSNARLRKFSHQHIARRYVIPSIIIIWTIVPLHVPVFVTVKEKTCIFEGYIELYNCIYGIVLVGIIPPGLMFLFSMLIFHNLKLRQQRQRQIHPFIIQITQTRRNPSNPLRKKDQQVLAMLLVQVLAYIASSTPYTITLLYVVLKLQKESMLDQPQADPTMLFILFITDLLRFVCPFASFYLFVLVSRLYRKEIICILSRIYGQFCLFYKRNRNHARIDLRTSLPPTTGVRRIDFERDVRRSMTPDQTPS